MRTRVKICGITRPEDAALAVSAGADAVGVIAFEPSPRCASLERAAEIRAAVPALVSLVLVTVDLDAAAHHRWIERLAPDLLQFHGSEDAALCDGFGLPYIKSLRMRDGIDADAYAARYPRARALLMDTYVPGVAGGTGASFDWRRARRAAGAPVILAGGLDPGNVGAAIETASPFAVDVSSSLESSPGVKCPRLVTEFLEAVRQADRRQISANLR